MSRFFLFLFLSLFTFSITAQTQTQTAGAETYAYKVIPGKEYLVSVAPGGNFDAVIGIGVDSSKPMSIVNNQGKGLSETYRLQATTDELQVCVYVNTKNGDHTIAVIDEDQKFPFYKWKAKTSVDLEIDKEGYIASFGFHWKTVLPVVSKASSDVNKKQFLAGGSAIAYTFPSHPQFPIDIMLVPESNHLDLALQIGTEEEFELNDNNRNPGDLSDTNKGQIEWLQHNPKSDSTTVVVVNKSDFGGSFRLAVRVLFNNRPAVRPTKWEYLDKAGLAKILDKSRSKLPLIDSNTAATFELSPVRTINRYHLAAYALDQGLNFALVVQIDPEKPPLFIQAGGTSGRSVVFSWSSDNGVVTVFGKDDKRLGEYKGYPTAGKIRVSVIGYGGQSRVELRLGDDTFAPMKLPAHKSVPRKAVSFILTAGYENYSLIQSNFRLYRFESEVGKTYNVQVNPFPFFDAVIMDPSGRNFENPTALGLVDEAGRGQSESLEVTATADFIEFAVAGTRYVNGLVDIDNKRLGGAGYYKLEVKDRTGNTPKLREELVLELPNEFVSSELELIYQPWDPFETQTASSLPPFSFVFDKRITKAMEHPLEPVNTAAKSKAEKNQPK